MEKQEVAKKLVRKNDPADAPCDGVFCFYDGLAYSVGSYLKVDGLNNKLLYCKADGTWELKDPPSKKNK